MAKTTYLLGAGASAGSLPVVDGFEKKLKELIAIFNFFLHQNKIHREVISNEGVKVFGMYEDVIRSLGKMLSGCEAHRSIDTYAKMLFLTGQEKEYHDLKCSIILFFELCRFYYKKTDKRYDAFLATILKRGEDGCLLFPTDINILSWNYDYEFERAFMKYTPDRENIHDSCKALNIIHKNSESQKNIADNFGVIKINGTIGFNNSKTNDPILGVGNFDISPYTFEPDNIVERNTFYERVQPLEVYNLLNSYYEHKDEDKLEPAISFSWEDGDKLIQIKEGIKAVLANTEKLIIVGYSFPYFNREIDKFIINNIKNYSTVDIYIQDKEDRTIDLINSIKELRPYRHPMVTMDDWDEEPRSITVETKFHSKTDLTQFYMPGD